MKISRAQSLTLALSTLVLFFTLSVVLIKRQNPSKQGSAAATPSPRSTDAAMEIEPGGRIVLSKFHRSEIKNGKKVWEVVADSGQYVPETQLAQIEHAMLWFFQKNGAVVQLKAGRAKLHLDGSSLKKASLEDGVELMYNEKVTLKTERAEYDKEKNSIFAPARVLIESEFDRVEGTELQANLETQVFTLERDVESVINPKAYSETRKNLF